MDESVGAKCSNRNFWSIDDIRQKIEKSQVVVFAKGSKDKARCGVSELAIDAVEHCGRPFELVDASEDSSIVAALRMYAGRKALPVVFANGKLVSSSETLQQMLTSGRFRKRLDDAFE